MLILTVLKWLDGRVSDLHGHKSVLDGGVSGLNEHISGTGLRGLGWGS